MDEDDRRRRLEALFEAHAGAVRAYARRRVAPSEADDVVSEVFAVAWRRIDDVPAMPLPWLLGCARNVISHQYRRTRRDAALADRLRDRLNEPAVGDGALGEALAALRQADRELLLLVAWEGLDAAQAAEVLGCSRNALGVRLHRARGRLAAALQKVESPPRAPVFHHAAEESAK